MLLLLSSIYLIILLLYIFFTILVISSYIPKVTILSYVTIKILAKDYILISII